MPMVDMTLPKDVEEWLSKLRSSHGKERRLAAFKVIEAAEMNIAKIRMAADEALEILREEEAKRE